MNRSAAIAVDYLDALGAVLRAVPPEPLAHTLDALLAARAAGRRVYVMGNGGSAAIASQFVCNLVKTAQVAGYEPLRAFALTDNTPSLTAWANDTAYDQVFARQIRALVEPDDVVIAISASGNSPNILAGLEAARAVGARTIGLLGFDGGRALELVEIAVHVPFDNYGLVEDTHMAIGHALTRAIRQALEREPVAASVAG
ncbi:MAG TPA: SIS domain-containing protein [Chloroflexota bacterium]|nr:SIS domain-containing protein [Chloroflexota bacterium]